MEEKTPLLHKLCAFRCLDFGTSAEVSKSNQIFYWEITFFSKSTLLQGEPFLTKFYTINSSPLLVTKYAFMLPNMLSNYLASVQCLASVQWLIKPSQGQSNYIWRYFKVSCSRIHVPKRPSKRWCATNSSWSALVNKVLSIVCDILLKISSLMKILQLKIIRMKGSGH